MLGQTEKKYVQRVALLDMEESLKVRKEAQPISSDTPPLPRTTLSRIQLPHFSGKYEDWPPFRDLFRSLIINDSAISSDVTQLHYLKANLKGEAELLVRSFPTTEENFQRARQVLLDYFENTRLLVRSYYAAYTALPKIKSELAPELRKLHCMTSIAGSLESIGRPIANSEDLFVYLTVEMLDPRSR